MFKGGKRLRSQKNKGQSSNQALQYPPAKALNEDQQIRRNLLETNRKIEPSRWICEHTLHTLGLHDEVKTLTERLGLWEFLCDEVQTYKNLTIEFLSTYEFDRSTRMMSFNLGGYYHELHTTALMVGFGLPVEQVENMCTTLSFYNDMTEADFRNLTCHMGILGDQRVKNVLHPTIRYLQRVLSHTLFARGETASVFNFGDMTYVCSMLRRNNGEMKYMPHIGYHLAKHLRNIAHSKQSGGVVRIGGIITKIARYLQVPTGDDFIEGYTLVDIAGLERARLIKFDDIEEAYINLGPGDIRHRLPLQTPLDPLNYATWKIIDEPLEPLPPPPPPVIPPPAPAQPAADDPQPQGYPTAQQMWDFMQNMQASMQTMHNSLADLRIHVDHRMDTIEHRMDEVETEAGAANFYAKLGVQQSNPHYEDDPPTPPYQRRAAMRKEQEMARAREEAAKLAAEQQGDAPPQGEESQGVYNNEGAADEEEENEEQTNDVMDHDAE